MTLLQATLATSILPDILHCVGYAVLVLIIGHLYLFTRNRADAAIAKHEIITEHLAHILLEFLAYLLLATGAIAHLMAVVTEV